MKNKEKIANKMKDIIAVELKDTINITLDMKVSGSSFLSGLGDVLMTVL